MIVFSHRYSKGDKFILESEAAHNKFNKTPIDFTIVRDTMYKYSKKAEERFFNDACFAYFFIQFAKSEQGRSYIENKLGNSG